MKKYLIVVMAAALALVGCKKKDNPALSPDDIQTYATLTGYVEYQRPVSVNSYGAVKVDNLPLANQVVEVMVSGSQYSSASSASKVTYSFTGTTDSNGMFSISVPVLKNGNGLNITKMSMRPFRLYSFPYPVNADAGWSIANKTVYHSGSLSISAPATIYPDNSYFCGNEKIAYTSFQIVGQ